MANIHNKFLNLTYYCALLFLSTQALCVEQSKPMMVDSAFPSGNVGEPAAMPSAAEQQHADRDARDQFAAQRQQFREMEENAKAERRKQAAELASSIRYHETEAEYQKRMEAEQNPYWLERQVQAKKALDAQISATPAYQSAQVTVDKDGWQSESLSRLDSQQMSAKQKEISDLNLLAAIPTISPDTIPAEMSTIKFVLLSLLLGAVTAWCIVFFIWMLLLPTLKEE